MKAQFYCGHIGRFNYQKNHEFLINIVNEMKKSEKDVKILLVGEGEKKEEIQNLVKKLQLEKNVIFAGIRKDIPQILSAMDILLLPSFYEGMPNVIIEAQATGLKCLISNTITKEANITGLVTYVSLTNDLNIWKNNILKNYTYKREDTSKILKQKGYDIKDVSDKFINIMFNNKFN